MLGPFGSEMPYFGRSVTYQCSRAQCAPPPNLAEEVLGAVQVLFGVSSSDRTFRFESDFIMLMFGFHCKYKTFILYPLFLFPYSLFLIPFPLFLIPFPLFLIAFPLFLIPFPLFHIPFPLFLISYSFSLIPYFLSCISFSISSFPYYSPVESNKLYSNVSAVFCDNLLIFELAGL